MKKKEKKYRNFIEGVTLPQKISMKI